MIAWQIWDRARTLIITGGAMAFGIVYLLPRLEGWVAGLIVLGLIVVAFALVFVWNRHCPPSFNIDPRSGVIDYEFRDADIAAAFAEANGASPVENPI